MSRALGNRTVKKLVDLLEGEGWLVSRVERTGRFIKEKDAFGLFDLLCINKDELLLIQSTTTKPHTHKVYVEFSTKYPVPSVKYEQWVWCKRKGWRRYVYVNGCRSNYDYRK